MVDELRVYWATEEEYENPIYDEDDLCAIVSGNLIYRAPDHFDPDNPQYGAGDVIGMILDDGWVLRGYIDYRGEFQSGRPGEDDYVGFVDETGIVYRARLGADGPYFMQTDCVGCIESDGVISAGHKTPEDTVAIDEVIGYSPEVDEIPGQYIPLEDLLSARAAGAALLLLL